jgi:hypothetical protein
MTGGYGAPSSESPQALQLEIPEPAGSRLKVPSSDLRGRKLHARLPPGPADPVVSELDLRVLRILGGGTDSAPSGDALFGPQRAAAQTQGGGRAKGKARFLPGGDLG